MVLAERTTEDAVPANVEGWASRQKVLQGQKHRIVQTAAVPDGGEAEGESAPCDEELRRPPKRGGLAMVTGCQVIIELG